MTIGSQSARSGSDGAELPKKLLSLLMAMVLAFSLVPSAAWAADAWRKEASWATYCII